MIQSKGNHVELSTQRVRPLSTTDWILNLGHLSLKPEDLWESTLAGDLIHNTWPKVKRSVSWSALNRIYEHHHATGCCACAEHNPKWGLTHLRHSAWNFCLFEPALCALPFVAVLFSSFCSFVVSSGKPKAGRRGWGGIIWELLPATGNATSVLVRNISKSIFISVEKQMRIFFFFFFPSADHFKKSVTLV